MQGKQRRAEDVAVGKEMVAVLVPSGMDWAVQAAISITMQSKQATPVTSFERIVMFPLTSICVGRPNDRRLSCRSTEGRPVGSVTVGGAVARPTADSEPDVRVPPHPAPRPVGPCQWYSPACAWS